MSVGIQTGADGLPYIGGEALAELERRVLDSAYAKMSAVPPEDLTKSESEAWTRALARGQMRGDEVPTKEKITIMAALTSSSRETAGRYVKRWEERGIHEGRAVPWRSGEAALVQFYKDVFKKGSGAAGNGWLKRFEISDHGERKADAVVWTHEMTVAERLEAEMQAVSRELEVATSSKRKDELRASLARLARSSTVVQDFEKKVSAGVDKRMMENEHADRAFAMAFLRVVESEFMTLSIPGLEVAEVLDRAKVRFEKLSPEDFRDD